MYESLHIMELLSVQCLQVDDVIPILLPAVYCGFGRCGSPEFTWWHCNVTKWIVEPDCDMLCGCRVTIICLRFTMCISLATF